MTAPLSRLRAALVLAFACLAVPALASPGSIARHADARLSSWLRRTDDYRTAGRRFARRDYAGARRLLERLSRRRDLSPADRRFLRRQIALCRARG